MGLGERGETLSRGQRQRIAIARAIVRDAPILLLDEPSAALDAESEELIFDALARLMEGRTSITITHRLATVRRADVIFVLSDGEISEQGTHGQLLMTGGLYSRLRAMVVDVAWDVPMAEVDDDAVLTRRVANNAVYGVNEAEQTATLFSDLPDVARF